VAVPVVGMPVLRLAVVLAVVLAKTRPVSMVRQVQQMRVTPEAMTTDTTTVLHRLAVVVAVLQAWALTQFLTSTVETVETDWHRS
jgi:hypothetical protein